MRVGHNHGQRFWWVLAALCSAVPVAMVGPSAGAVLPPTDSFSLDAPLSGHPGDEMTVAVLGTNSTPIKGYSITFTFDSAVFEFLSSTIIGTRGEGASLITPGNTASAARAGVVYSFACPPAIPAGSGSMLIVTLRLKPGAPAGDTYLVLADQSPSLNRMAPCGSGTIVPSLSGLTVQVLALPTGACCVPSGACAVTAEATCLSSGAWHDDWAACDPNPCPQPPPVTGACCDPATGDCTITTQAACRFDWLGAGMECRAQTCPVPQPPPVTGACCALAGTCAVTTPADCQAPAIWHGEWLSCTPSPCPQPQGPCCDPAGICVLTLQADCAAPDIWQSDPPSCTPNRCPQPPQPSPVGSCCFADGSCTVTTESACPGSWTLSGTCAPNLCPPGPDNTPGACCAPDHTCTVAIHTACPAASAWYTGLACDPTPCNPPGACCARDDTCTLTGELDCISPAAWSGAYTVCEPSPCVTPTERTSWGSVKTRYRPSGREP